MDDRSETTPHRHVCGTPGGLPRGSPPRRSRFAAFALGFSAIAIQTLVLRELMVAWLGDETSFGVTLAVWLLAAGLGSALGGRFLTRTTAPSRRLAVTLAALALLSPVALLTARGGRLILGAHEGELAGLGQLLAAALLSAAPFAIAAGAAFSLAVRVLAGDPAAVRRDAAAHVYAIEAVGAVCAGLLLSFVLIPHLRPLPIAGVGMLLLSASGALLLTDGAQPTDAVAPARPSTRPVRLVPAVAALIALILLSPLGARFDERTVRAQWAESGYVLSRDSVHGRVVATRRGDQLSIYESGVLAASAPDLLAAEEAVHIPMLEHPAPERILLVGGGLGGSVAEVLRHPTVTSVDYVELDPTLLLAAREAFADSLLEGLADPRVRTHHGDARLFIRSGSALYDVVILNVPDPTTMQLNRFYTVEFFEEARRRLADDGIMGLAVSGSENYVSPELAVLLRSLERSLAVVFDRVAVLPGDPCHLIAGGAAADPTRVGARLADEVERRGIDTRFVARHYLEDRFSAERLASFDETLARTRAAGLNRDLSPRGYLAELVLRSRLRSGETRFLDAIRHAVGLPMLAALGGLIVLAFGAGPRLLEHAARRSGGDSVAALARAVVLSVVVVGFSEMSLEISAIVAYQSLYGYVYGRLALITAAFMAGLAFGGWLGMRLTPRVRLDRGYILLQCGLTAVPLGFGLAVARLGAAASSGHAVAVVFPVLVAASAVLAGTQFPLAAAILLDRTRTPVARQGGTLYAADLFGAALGAVAASLLLLPVLGMAGTMAGLAVLNLSVLISLALTARGCGSRPA